MWNPLALLLSLVPSQQSLTPRVPWAKEPLHAAGRLAEHDTARELVVKFADSLRVRPGSDGGLVSESKVGLENVQRVVQRHELGFRTLLQSPPTQIVALEARAAERSGRAQPDLLGMFAVRVPNPTVERLLAIGRELQSLDEVEFVEIEERRPLPPNDYPPMTPALDPNQGHRFPDPGLDFVQAFARGATGAGIKLSDCEYGWDHLHEDLVDQNITPEPGQTPDPFVQTNGWHHHGTAALGVSAAAHNGYGCEGGAPLATFATFPEYTVEGGSRRATAIANAIAGSAPGDVVLLEMQTGGAGGGYGPAELNQSVWTVVRVGTDADVVVVGAAGNGAQDLDSAPYAPYMARGDSGAILVGAGTNSTSHAPLGFSTYGSRVDVQGWGTGVFTLGYGGFAQYGGDEHQAYTATFNGTSSGSATIAACTTALQSYALLSTGAPLGPHEIRALLIQTGIPQAPGTVEIGPLPDINAAMDTITCGAHSNYCLGATNSIGSSGQISMTGSHEIPNNDLVLHASDCIPNNFGIFLMAPGTQSIFLGNGILCLDLPWRLAVVATLPDGSAGFAYDNTPDPGNPWTVTPGSTWRFQFWYRDGTSSNLTDGLEVTFCQ